VEQNVFFLDLHVYTEAKSVLATFCDDYPCTSDTVDRHWCADVAPQTAYDASLSSSPPAEESTAAEATQ
jgi:hypothetical protein